MPAGMRISFMEMLLMKGILATKYTFKDPATEEKWAWSDRIEQYVGARNVNKAMDAALANGLIELDPTTTESARGVRLTSLGNRLLKAAEPEFFAAHKWEALTAKA